MSSERNLIELKNLSLELPAVGMPADGVTLGGHVGGRLIEKGGRVRSVRVLDDLSLSIPSGTCVGVIGLNGAGKSSLLRILAGIYQPSSGVCHVEGQVSTLFSNQLGLNQNASGVENIKLMALLLGMKSSVVDELIEDVTRFSELGDFMHMPVRTYSAGMKTRIGFGVATSGEPDVLLIDEVFGTGDHAFVTKARARLEKLIGRSGAVVLASHSAELMKVYASHLLWLQRGKIKMFDTLPVVLDEYRKDMAQAKKLGV